MSQLPNTLHMCTIDWTCLTFPCDASKLPAFDTVKAYLTVLLQMHCEIQISKQRKHNSNVLHYSMIITGMKIPRILRELKQIIFDVHIKRDYSQFFYNSQRCFRPHLKISVQFFTRTKKWGSLPGQVSSLSLAVMWPAATRVKRGKERESELEVCAWYLINT